MANETILSAISSDQAEAAVANYLLMLQDRNWLGNLPTLHYAGSVNGMNSNVLSVRHFGLMGYDSTASTADGSAVANTVLSDGKTQITVAKYSHSLAPGDIAKIVLGDILNPQALALNAACMAAGRLSDLICDVVDGFTATAGPGSGVDLDIPSLLAAVAKMGTLNVDKSKGFSGLLHGQQMGDILVDSASTGGAIQFTFANDEAKGLLELKGGGYKGRWAGVDWTESNRVVTANAGADRAGAIWAYGGVVWGDGLYTAEDADQLVLGGHCMLERSRDATSGVTKWVTHALLGASKALEAGVTVISDA